MNAGTRASSIFGERRLPHVLITSSCQPLCKAAKQSVAGESSKERRLHTLSDYSSCPRTHGSADDKADKQHCQQSQGVFSRPCFREHRREWPHQDHHRLHALEHHQYGQVQRQQDEDATDHGVDSEFACISTWGSYTHRVALSNHRLIDYDGERVTFRWKDHAHGNQRRTMTLTARECFRRSVLHTLPRGVVRSRAVLPWRPHDCLATTS